ncbi:MAG: hypothetical protein RJA78_1040, partial [Actinomycetota bacterium]
MMNPLKALLPKDPKTYLGYRVVRVITLVFLLIVVVRSFIHLFSPDGGAQSIAGIDTSVAGGINIIAIFHQWGAIQLLLVLVLITLFFSYKGLTSLVILFLSLDAPLRSVAGLMGKVESTQTPPGEALNWPAFIFLLLLFIASLLKNPSQKA